MIITIMIIIIKDLPLYETATIKKKIRHEQKNTEYFFSPRDKWKATEDVSVLILMKRSINKYGYLF